MTLVKKIKEWAKNGKSIWCYVDNWIEYIAFIFVALIMGIGGIIIILLTIVTIPIWLLPYMLYMDLKEKEK